MATGERDTLFPEQIGVSVEGRPIIAYSTTHGTTRDGNAPTLALIHGGIHGDEPGATLVVERLVAHLCANRRDDDPHIVLVPAVNPDGLAAHRKNNARGIDLNRNFPARSFRATDDAHPAGYDPGPRPLSEPESAALAALIDRERPARLVAVHQPFACVNFDGPARDLAERMSRACGWPVAPDIGYPTPGSFGSRYGVDLARPVITLELPRPATEADLQRALAALLVACTP